MQTAASASIDWLGRILVFSALGALLVILAEVH